MVKEIAKRNRSRTLLLSLAVLSTAGAIAGLGTFALYSSQAAPVGADVTAGFVTIGLGSSGAKTNRLTTAVTDLEPGDTLFRSFDLISSSTLLSSVTLTTSDTASGTKLSSIGSGLQMTLQRCSVPWTEAGVSPAFTYTCTGGGATLTTLVPTGDVLGTRSLTGLDAMNSGVTVPTTDHLMVTMQLPTASPSADQSASSIINYLFTGIQLTPPKSAR